MHATYVTMLVSHHSQMDRRVRAVLLGHPNTFVFHCDDDDLLETSARLRFSPQQVRNYESDEEDEDDEEGEGRDTNFWNPFPLLEKARELSAKLIP